MKKIATFILSIFIVIVGSLSFAEDKPKYILLKPLTVRNFVLDDYYDIPISTIPANIEITIETEKTFHDKNWCIIKWFSNNENKYKKAFTSKLNIEMSTMDSLDTTEKELSEAFFEALRIREKYEKRPINEYYQSTQSDLEELNKAIFLLYIDIDHNYKNKNKKFAEESLTSLFFCKSLVYYSMNLYQKSILELNQCIKIDKNYAPAYVTRGNLQEQLGFYTKAKEDYIVAKNLYARIGLEKEVILLTENIKRINKELAKLK